MLATASAWAREHAGKDRFDDSAYWSTDSEPGRETLQRALAESSFWSGHLYATGSRVAFALAGSSVTACFVVLLFLILAGGQGAAETVARLTVLIITALIGGDALTVAADWRASAAVSREACARFRLMSPPMSDAELLRLYTDYRAATAAAEPIPGLLYERKKAMLNRAWASEHPLAQDQ
jgi:hypothetical protein